MCLPERVAIFNCYDANANVLFTGDKKFVLLFHWRLKMNVLSRGGGKFVLLVKKTTYVFARGGANFELL